jgi:two-component system, chemotaxis family, sensor kinase CheA
MSKEQEYKAMFVSEALANLEELNNLLAKLEKNPEDKRSIDAIFRITHTLKGNAAGMGFEKISKFAHVMEDMFALIKEGRLSLDEEAFTALFKALDILSALTDEISDPTKTVQHRGAQRKMEVLMERAINAPIAETPVKTETANKKPVKKSPAKTEQSEEQKEEETAESNMQVLNEEQEAAMMESKEDESHKVVFSDLVQVPVKKLDDLLNLVGELIIERDRLIANTEHLQTNRNEFSRLNRISSDLQYSVMDVRLVQVGFLFNKFHRVVRDAAKAEGKEVDLIIEGSDTEIDRNILQIISDALIHLIRNAIGHGIEVGTEREKLQKAVKGHLKLSARNESEGVVIEITDDGKGLDLDRILKKSIEKGWVDPAHAARLSQDEIISFIFQPGFSTSATVNSISGRGVGMDVVKKALDSIGGNIKVKTIKNEGTTFALTLPASMAVKGTLLFEVMNTQYAIPLTFTDAVLSVPRTEIRSMQNRLMISHLGKTIEAIYLKDLFFPDRKEAVPQEANDKLNVIIVQYNGRTLGLIVDRLLQQKEIVEKPLKKPVDFVKYVGGVTIMGNGNVCLVINVPQIMQGLFQQNFKIQTTNTSVA